ncbi:MAG TPA: carbohydrate kinase family protein [Longimicrobiales bacterium]|nr:carbohydrate kinase family protein [Longimicrobiales bacterium]
MTAERTLGVIGTLVWDRILDRDGRAEPVEEWGGIGYALAALSASLPEGWSVMPILKLGRDLAEDGRRFLREIPRLSDAGIVVVPEPNNRVELRYESSSRRCERLTGGVPPWTWPELAPLVGMCDALYVNFISGFEMELDTARTLRTGYPGPSYADLHSLFLGMNRHGHRIPRTLEAWAAWLRCFDAVQMNEDEFDLLGASGDPWQLAAGALGPDLKLITVTLGQRGAAYVASSGFDAEPLEWRARRGVAVAGRAQSGKVELTEGPRTGDPTGCGDVWGATTFARLLAGDDLQSAMRQANRLAGRNVEHRGARGLFRHLGGRLSHVEGQG